MFDLGGTGTYGLPGRDIEGRVIVERDRRTVLQDCIAVECMVTRLPGRERLNFLRPDGRVLLRLTAIPRHVSILDAQYIEGFFRFWNSSSATRPSDMNG